VNDLLTLIESRLRERCRSHLHLGAKGFEAALRRERVALADMLMHMLDAFELASSTPNGFQGYAEAGPEARPEAKPEPPTAPGVRKQPSQEVLERARKLQALAMGSTSAGERDNAWAAFGKLWEEYVLPNDLGMK
jgi:hypothetical protein